MGKTNGAKKASVKKSVVVEKTDDVREDTAGVLDDREPKMKKVKREVAVVPVKRPTEVAPSNPNALIAMAIEKGTNVDALEKLMGLQERWEAREAKKAYDKAMAAFQAECPTITKTKVVKTKAGDVAYRYAPIESIVSQVKDILEKHGFSYSTSMELQDKGVKVAVKVVHEQGHSEISEMAVPFGTMTAIMSASQQAAAAQTFAKRYAFCNAFGILTGDEDNDGANISTGNRASDVAPAAPVREPERVIEMEPEATHAAKPAPAAPAAPAKQAHRCDYGGEVITEQEAIYSIRMYGRPLCRAHQADHKAGKIK